jgi:hypothetical protein
MFSSRGERLAPLRPVPTALSAAVGMTAANVGKIGAVVDPTPMVQDIETAWCEIG